MPQVATPTQTLLAPQLSLLDSLTESERPLLRPGRPTLLTFLRGTWCSSCQTFVQRLVPLHETLQARGVDLVGVVCQGRHWVRSWLNLNPLPFPLLVDEQRAAAKAFDVYKALGLDGIHIARPATFLIDGEGRVLWRYVGDHKDDRPADEGLLAALERLP
ncbi:peroxiredoxin family protein [Myxococcus sp. K15C18031901]|uniref:peroxiredoxin family protein n=1 Tax=Myxococcus dinghuensis TaxID=2906761 RepID=UPI0020A82183|nr:peroxiredoxin family protein [Myxococcus dinghuensis]MCP3099221.1 peroxiredoxin family protein [Myxococcus dinghuensis]